MRCFIAVETPLETKRVLARLQKRIASVAPGVRWVRPEQMHLTLVFPGEVEDDFPDAAAGPLAAACAAHRAFGVRLTGLGAFPDPRRARVVWVGVDPGREELVGLQRSVSSALESLGYETERRPFSPHLTLGRLRTPADVAPAVATGFAGDEVPVERVSLIRSELRPDGPCYTDLAVFPLARPA